MKIKLVEAEQPISKLDYNIQNILLPAFKEYGLNFNSTPNRINAFVETYKGVSPTLNSFISLRLTSASKEIDLWNDASDEGDLFTADLFGTLYVGAKAMPLGALSSKDPESVKMAIDGLDEPLGASKSKSAEEQKKQELIVPKNKNTNYKAMTREEWKAEKDKLEDELNKARKAVDEEFPDESVVTTGWAGRGTEDEYASGAIVDYWKSGEPGEREIPESIRAQRKALDNYNYFMKYVYPLEGGY
jgi:hypothetical protein